MRDGLPDMKIECLFEDSAGRLWIGTHDRGAVCFDGSSFRSFIKAEGLAGDGTFSITERPPGASGPAATEAASTATTRRSTPPTPVLEER